MQKLKTPLVILILFALILGACKGRVADEVPTEAEVVEDPTLLDLMPQETTLIASYQIDAFQKLRKTSPLPSAIIDFAIPNLAALPDLLGDERLEGLDEEGALYIALSREGFVDTLEALRLASPRLLMRFEEEIAEELHLRIIVPAVDAELLAQGITKSCEARQIYRCDAQVRGSFAVLDLALGVKEAPGAVQPAMTSKSALGLPALLSGADVEVRPWSEDRPIAEGFTVEPSAAWKAFSEGAAPLALYGPMEGVFDQFAIFDLLNHRAQERTMAEETKLWQRAHTLSELALAYTYESPDVAESQDVVFLMSNNEDALFIDALASLTEYGQRLVSTLAKSSKLRQRTLSNPVLDVRFGLDLTEAVEEASRPKWATDIEGVDGADVPMLESMSRSGSWGLAVASLYSPITGYTLYNELIGPETTPAEFAMIRGFWLQVYGMEDSDFSASPSVTSSLGLQLPTDAPAESFEEFAIAALMPFGSPVSTQSVLSEDALEFQAASNRAVEELFSPEEISVEPGVKFMADFKGIAALLNAPRVQPHVEGPILFGINFLANLGTSKLFAHAGFEQGQGLMRLQLGGEELVPMDAVEGGVTPVVRTPVSPCLHQARVWSFGALMAFGWNHRDNPEEGELALDLTTGALEELADQCEGDEDAEKIRTLSSELKSLKE